MSYSRKVIALDWRDRAWLVRFECGHSTWWRPVAPIGEAVCLKCMEERKGDDDGRTRETPGVGPAESNRGRSVA
jgi:hypothetical protein